MSKHQELIIWKTAKQVNRRKGCFFGNSHQTASHQRTGLKRRDYDSYDLVLGVKSAANTTWFRSVEDEIFMNECVTPFEVQTSEDPPEECCIKSDLKDSVCL